jgi:DNA-binding transcriptional regulator GbsR (MarR family)
LSKTPIGNELKADLRDTPEKYTKDLHEEMQNLHEEIENQMTVEEDAVKKDEEMLQMLENMMNMFARYERPDNICHFHL